MLHINGGMPGAGAGGGAGISGATTGGDGAAGGGGGAGLPNQLVNALLQYRMQVPMVEKMIAELGLNLNGGGLVPDDLGAVVEPKAPSEK